MSNRGYKSKMFLKAAYEYSWLFIFSADHSPVNFRPSPTHMRLSPSPPTSLTSSINGGHSHQNNNTPPPTYARVSNLKKNHGNSPTRNVRFADEESNQVWVAFFSHFNFSQRTIKFLNKFFCDECMV